MTEKFSEAGEKFFVPEIDKFDENDRKKLISEIEKIKGFKLTKIFGKDKLLKENDGNLYIIFGGKGTWHTIDAETLEIVEREVSKTGKEVFLAFGNLLNSRVVIYLGPLEIPVLKKGNFTGMRLKIGDDFVTPKKFSGFRMKRFGEYSWTEQEREKERQFQKFMREIKTMSEEERRGLLKSLTDEDSEEDPEN